MKVTVKTIDAGSEEFELQDEVMGWHIFFPPNFHIMLLIGYCHGPQAGDTEENGEWLANTKN